MIIDQYGRAVAESDREAQSIRTPDTRPIHFVKSDRMKRKYQQEGRRVVLSSGRYCPPSYGKRTTRHTGGTIYVKEPPITRREHQEKAIEFAYKKYMENKRSCMIISGTGSGKTYTMYGIVQTLQTKTVIVCPNSTIVKEVYDTMILGNSRVKILKGTKKLELGDITIMTGATFNKAYEHINGQVGLLLCDECHRLPERRREQMNKWKGDFIVGLTATPDRKDFKEEGFAMYFGESYDTKVQSLPVHVCPYEFMYNYTKDELVKASEGLAPDSPELYRRLMINNKERTDKLVAIVKKLRSVGYRNIIVFTDRKEHVINLTARLMREGIRARDYYSETQKEQVIAEFDDGVIVGSTGCCGEGFNIPKLQAGILFVSTSEKKSVDQYAGRVRRSYGDKTHGLFIDFIDNMRFNNGKTKKLGRYERRKAYKQLGWTMHYNKFLDI